MRSTVPIVLLLALLGTACAVPEPAAPREPEATDILPLRTLRLYETGVGYFERSGPLGAHGTGSLPVPPGQLDDALASLVVLQGGERGGLVAGLSFASSVTKATARSRAGLPADPANPIAYRDLLESMKGERVTMVLETPREPAEAGERSTLAGRVVEVAMDVDEALARRLAMQPDASEPPKRLTLTLLTYEGALVRAPAERIVRIRPTDPAFARRIDEALDSTGTRGASKPRSLRLEGDVHGEVTFGYVTETPLWRTSYRLVLGSDPAKQPAVLQGWALVHNDTEEDWRGIHLELVNGQPDSFLFPMAAPRYARRELVHPEADLSTLPQLHDTTADAMWGDHLDESGIALGGMGTTGQGFGSGHGRLARTPTVRQGGLSGTTASSLLDVGNLAGVAQTSASEHGSLFVYAVPASFSLEAHRSSLVPFLQKPVTADTITHFAGAGSPGRTALRFTNTTGQTLPTGTLTVFAASGFSGETSLDRLKPGDRRFLAIGNDLDAVVERTKAVDTHEEDKRVTFDGAVLSEHYLKTTVETWSSENRAASARPFFVSLSSTSNATVTGADALDFDESTQSPMAILQMQPHEKRSRVITVVQGLSRKLTVDSLTEAHVKKLIGEPTLDRRDGAALKAAFEPVRAFEAARAALAKANGASAATERALDRLRKDVKALGGEGASGGVAAAPLVKRIADAEDRHAAAETAKEAAEAAVNARREAVVAALEPLREKAP